jgi:acyl-CoA synthetase (AMP-forming)/AMP-acid ligase II
LEIEEVLAEVVIAAAFGVPDDLAGEAVHALVVPIASSDLSEEQLLRFCRQRLPAYKVQKRIGMACTTHQPIRQDSQGATARRIPIGAGRRRPLSPSWPTCSRADPLPEPWSRPR